MRHDLRNTLHSELSKQRATAGTTAFKTKQNKTRFQKKTKHMLSQQHHQINNKHWISGFQKKVFFTKSSTQYSAD